MNRIFLLLLCCFPALTNRIFAQSFSANLNGNPVNTTGWTYATGTSFVAADEFVLTRPQTSQAGYIYYSTPQDLTVCARFTVQFEFRFTDHSVPTADGIAFWYITNPPTGFTLGGGIGLPNNPNGLLLVMDTYNNDGVLDNPLVSLRLLDGTGNYTEGSATGRLAPDLINRSFLTDGAWHSCKLEYNYGDIEISFDGGPVVMTGFTALNMSGYFGFSAGTGSAWSRQSIRNVRIEGAPNPNVPIVNNVAYCQYDTPLPLDVTGVNLKWYTSLTGGVPLPATPVVNTSVPGVTTWYVTQTTPGCPYESDREPVTVTVYEAVTADFTDTLRYGCGGDTVFFTYGGPAVGNYQWDFGDGNTALGRMPWYKYQTPGTYRIKLKVENGSCVDSSETTVVVRRFLSVDFNADADSICQHDSVQFTNLSAGEELSYFWDFGDGTTDTIFSPVHAFDRAGTFRVMLAVRDFRPCYDTVYQTIVVDSVSDFGLILSDSNICVGTVVFFNTDYAPTGNSSITWDLGEGPGATELSALQHAYETAGVFNVTVTGDYRFCPDTTIRATITVHPYPIVNLGPDTALCPGYDPLTLVNLEPQPAGYRNVWSTGDSLNTELVVYEPGKYWLEVFSARNCSTTDTIDVLKSCYIGIPNVFTPNGDGVNDYFFPRQLLARAVRHFRMQVFNRWGQLVFETAKVDGRGWDGKLNDQVQPQGVYVYMIEAGFANGTEERYQGNVSLLR